MIRPLALYPYPVAEADGKLIRAAKASLQLDFQVQPSPAVPGGPVRVLALRDRPPWLCDAAIVMDPSKPGALESALQWVLTDRPVEEGYSVLTYLKSIFGPEVKEVDDGDFSRGLGDDSGDQRGPTFR